MISRDTSSLNFSQGLSVHVIVMPHAFAPWVLLALATLDILADWVGTFTTAIRADHLSTADLVIFGALKESRSFLAVREKESDLDQSFFRNLERFGIVLVDFEGKCSSFVGTAGTAAHGAALILTIAAL